MAKKLDLETQFEIVRIVTVVLALMTVAFFIWGIFHPYMSIAAMFFGIIAVVVYGSVLPYLRDRITEIRIEDYQYLTEVYPKLPDELQLRVGDLLNQERITVSEFDKVQPDIQSVIKMIENEESKQHLAEVKMKAKQVTIIDI